MPTLSAANHTGGATAVPPNVEDIMTKQERNYYWMPTGGCLLLALMNMIFGELSIAALWFGLAALWLDRIPDRK